MDFQFDTSLDEFRREVRAFVADNLPAHIATRQRHKSFAPDDLHTAEWQAILHRKGWSVPAWPVEHGGTGWSPLKQFVFNDECAALDAPVFPWGPRDMVGPILYTFGSEALKARFLPMIREGRYYWCQGFSEPGSGSDLASLRTTAQRRGDHYIVNGQKIWTSGAAVARFGFFLVKTDTRCKPQQGISFLIIDMNSPGVTVRPIPQIDGDDHLCEVFLDNVEVPAEHLVGEEGKGWTYAKHLLDHERTGSAYIFWNKRELAKVREIALGERRDGVAVIDSEPFRTRLARAEARLIALEWSVLRILADEQSHWHPTALASCLKVRGAQLQQEITALQQEAMGVKGLRYMAPHELDQFQVSALWPDYLVGKTSVALIARAATIYGGTLQVQRGIIARTAFGV